MLREQRQQIAQRRLCDPAQTRSIDMKGDVVVASEVRYPFEDSRAFLMITRIAADEQHIDRPLLALRVGRQVGIIGGRKIFRSVSELLEANERRWKIADHEVIAGE